MKNYSGKTVSIVFISIIAALGLYFLFSEKKTFSDTENRELASAPSLFSDEGINTDFLSELEKYYSDAFPFRDGFLSFNRKINTAYALKLPVEDESVNFATVEKAAASTTQKDTAQETEEQAADGQSLERQESEPSAGTPLSDGSQNSEPVVNLTSVPIVNDRAFELFVYSEERVKAFAGAVNSLAQNTDAAAYVIIPPSASELYLPEKYRKPENEQKQAFDLLDSLVTEAKVVNLYEKFKNSQDEYIYFRTDHHWTADGAYLAYGAFCQAAGLNPVRLEEMQSGQMSGFLGSLYKSVSQKPGSERLAGHPDFVRYYMPVYNTEVFNYNDAEMTDGESREILYPNYGRDTNLYNVFFGGDMHLMHMRSDVDNGRSIMVIRDSYGHAFLPFLANNYEDVYAVEPRYFDEFNITGFMKEHKVDELLIIGYSLPVSSQYWFSFAQELNKMR